MHAAILRPARLSLIFAKLLLFAEADGRKLCTRNTYRNQIILGRRGARLTQRHVVFGRSPLIAVALDLQLVFRILAHNRRQFLRVRVQGLHRILAQSVRVVIEVCILNMRQQLVNARPRLRVRITRRLSLCNRLRRSCARRTGRRRRRRVVSRCGDRRRRWSVHRNSLFRTGRTEYAKRRSGRDAQINVFRHQILPSF